MSALLNIPGSYTVQYPAGNINERIDGYSPNQIKEQLATVFKELATATVNVNGGVITFTLPSGQKNG